MAKILYLNKWGVIVGGLLILLFAFLGGAAGGYLLGKGIVYGILVLIALYIFGLRFHIR